MSKEQVERDQCRDICKDKSTIQCCFSSACLVPYIKISSKVHTNIYQECSRIVVGIILAAVQNLRRDKKIEKHNDDVAVDDDADNEKTIVCEGCRMYEHGYNDDGDDDDDGDSDDG
eukprot:183537-Hanusia_phi.AAC.1